jgi:hypothetical protein
MRRVSWLWVGLVLVTLVGDAAARRGSTGLVGKVALGKTALPGKLDRSAEHKLRRSARGRAVFYQDAKTGGWKIYYAAVLAQAPVGSTVTLKIFDVSHDKQFVGTREKMIFGDDVRLVSGSFTLAKDEVFDPNAKLLVEVESGDALVASRVFYIQGKREAYAGVVDFTGDDGGGGDDGAVTAESRRGTHTRR